jgi:hypothetical protein
MAGIVEEIYKVTLENRNEAKQTIGASTVR